MRAHPMTWTLRALWLGLPFTVGAQVADALEGRSDAIRWTATVGLWIGWAVLAVAMAVPRPATLTLVRFGVPASVVVAAAALLAADASAGGVLGAALAVVAAVAACSSAVADDFVDGGSYGPERRWSLRAPAVLLLGPIPLVWALGVAGILGGPLVAAGSGEGAGARVVGALAALVGLGAAVVAGRSLHTLSTRYLVFVPRGLTLVDPLVVVQPVHFPRAAMARVGPALAGTDALDLSRGAPGLAVEIELTGPVELAMVEGRRRATERRAARVTVTPGRPGSMLAAAGDHRLPVG